MVSFYPKPSEFASLLSQLPKNNPSDKKKKTITQRLTNIDRIKLGVFAILAKVTLIPTYLYPKQVRILWEEALSGEREVPLRVKFNDPKKNCM